MAGASDSAVLDEIERDFDRILIRDAMRLRRRLDSMRNRRRQGRPIERSIAVVRQQVERSMRARRARESSVPSLTFPESLPISQHRSAIADAIRGHQVVVVHGETGSGKTTQLPKICLDIGRGVSGLIGHTQPRRIAARAVAARLSDELGTPMGAAVGYQVRFVGTVAEGTLVKLMTDGILLAETQRDRLLSRYDTIILDEAHERSLNVDFLLGYLKQLLPARPDLKVIVTSATIDPGRFADHFDSGDGQAAPIIGVSGRSYPVEMRYRPIGATDDSDEDSPEVQRAISEAVEEVLRTGTGDILAFLSGEREIRMTARTLRKRHGDEVEILPLYARLSGDEQRRVFDAHRRRRIVLATNVAETSLTVPGITAVIDPGFARISRYSARRKVQGLPIEPISQASAKQRAGRCGRTGPGVCIRLYSEDEMRSRDEYTSPEIMRTNLASVILRMKSLGLGEVDRFPFVESPSERAIADGYETLFEIGAIDGIGADAKLTDVGERLAMLPIDPRIGRMILASVDEDVLGDVLVIASALSCQDPRVRPFEQRGEADTAHKRFVVEGGALSDFLSLLALWDEYHRQKEALSRRKLTDWCRASFISPVRMREWMDVQRQLMSLCRELDLGSVARKPTELTRGSGEGPASFDRYGPIHRALLTGLITNVGVLAERHEYVGPRERRFSLFPGSLVFEHSPKWVMAAEIVRTTKVYARMVARVQPRWIERAGEHLVRRTWTEPHWHERRGQVWAHERVTLFGMVLVPRRHRHYGPHDPRASREVLIQRGLVDGLLASSARFVEHNRRLIERLSEIRARTRRSDLQASEQARFEFYNSRLPPGIFTGQALEDWVIREQRRDPEVLCMRESDLLPDGVCEFDEQAFPTSVSIGGATLPVLYRYEPGAPDDGVTVRVPLAVLSSIRPEQLSWMVPGIRRELITELIRTLPKETRRRLGPVAEVARTLEGRVQGEVGPVEAVVARELSRMTGLEIGAADFAPKMLPEHLRPNLRVEGTGEEGERCTLAESRDLAHLRSVLTSARARSDPGEWSPDWMIKGMRSWTIGDLPEHFDRESGEARVRLYPAIAPMDEDSTGAEVRLAASPNEARRLHRLGLRRLLVCRVGGEIRFLVSHLPSWERLLLLHGPIGTSSELEVGLEALIVEHAFLRDPGEVRSAERFEALLDRGWHRIGESGAAVASLVESILIERQGLSRILEGEQPQWRRSATASVLHQVEHLLSRGFLLLHSLERLEHLPRYLAAARIRLERLSARDEQDDAGRQLSINALWNPYARLAGAIGADDSRQAALERFRWSIEELRVSLFAQELGTVERISADRLEAQWREIVEGTACSAAQTD